MQLVAGSSLRCTIQILTVAMDPAQPAAKMAGERSNWEFGALRGPVCMLLHEPKRHAIMSGFTEGYRVPLGSNANTSQEYGPERLVPS